MLSRMMITAGGEPSIFAQASQTDHLASAGRWPRLILIDQQLPDLPGTVLCKRLRESGYTGELALMSASPEMIDANAVTGLRVDCLLRKPIAQLVLGILVRRAGRLNRTSSAA
ncbi:MAG: hypothetical protein IBJ18_08265 [Phycisphaerales bacterium]|nr:hypothetical protein [Phycisphaerales bacterium]